jgi:hypothetical protein
MSKKYIEKEISSELNLKTVGWMKGERSKVGKYRLKRQKTRAKT